MNDRQQVLRVTNQEIRRVSADVGADDGEFVCECGSKECREVIRLTFGSSMPFVPRPTGHR
jgi:hypothetical protein